jgi:hypothetical protein
VDDPVIVATQEEVALLKARILALSARGDRKAYISYLDMLRTWVNEENAWSAEDVLRDFRWTRYS